MLLSNMLADPGMHRLPCGMFIWDYHMIPAAGHNTIPIFYIVMHGPNQYLRCSLISITLDLLILYHINVRSDAHVDIVCHTLILLVSSLFSSAYRSAMRFALWVSSCARLTCSSISCNKLATLRAFKRSLSFSIS